MRRAIAAAEAAAPAMKALGSWQRKAILMHCVERFTERKDELAMALCVEAGKPIKARGPARRAAHQTVTCAFCAFHVGMQLRHDCGRPGALAQAYLRLTPALAAGRFCTACLSEGRARFC